MNKLILIKLILADTNPFKDIISISINLVYSSFDMHYNMKHYGVLYREIKVLIS
jgi:hypothetical protein